MSPGGLTGIVNAASKCNLILGSRAEARVAPGWTGRDDVRQGSGIQDVADVMGFVVVESVERGGCC